MVFDNRVIVTRLNMRRYIVLLAYFICIGVVLLSGFFYKPILGLSKTDYVIIFSSLYIIYVVFVFVMDYNFFYFNDENNKFVFRFVSLRPFDNKKRAIEIKKNELKGYSIKKSVFNLKQNLVLSVKTKTGNANYPPISITALSNKHKIMLEDSLK